ncbi:RNI-like protein [Trametes coccinea BRFM310]|uniref:RNI-like protein n=1 Tax=Trametes coccinea (strain BRFM310) TaxID=1353009 RepID=A0A1Y2IV40_TRAC3|nr:RNI-like protein [Trametes coccinea BRFM310]
MSNIFDLRNRELRLDTRPDIEPHFKAVDLASIEELYLAYNTFGIGAAEALGEYLSKMKLLKVAGLSDIFGTRTIDEIPQALTAICHGLRSCTQLVELNLSGNAFGARVVEPLASFITHHRSLQVIKLYDNGFGPVAGSTIAQALVDSAHLSREEGVPSNLHVIICGRNRLEDRAALVWAEAIASHANLRKVKLVDNGIREAGFSALVRALRNCHHLRYLSLRDTVSTEELEEGDDHPERRGWQEMIDLLQTAKELKFLDLSDCYLPQPAIAALTEVYAADKVSRLQTLLLENNDIDEASYDALVDAVVHHLPALRVLSLAWNNDLESDAVQALSKALEERGGHLVIDDEHDDDLAGDGLDRQKDTEYVRTSVTELQQQAGANAPDAVDDLTTGIARMGVSDKS